MDILTKKTTHKQLQLAKHIFAQRETTSHFETAAAPAIACGWDRNYNKLQIVQNICQQLQILPTFLPNWRQQCTSHFEIGTAPAIANGWDRD